MRLLDARQSDRKTERHVRRQCIGWSKWRERTAINTLEVPGSTGRSVDQHLELPSMDQCAPGTEPDQLFHLQSGQEVVKVRCFEGEKWPRWRSGQVDAPQRLGGSQKGREENPHLHKGHLTGAFFWSSTVTAASFAHADSFPPVSLARGFVIRGFLIPVHTSTTLMCK